jgi:hypothetical protein
MYRALLSGKPHWKLEKGISSSEVGGVVNRHSVRGRDLASGEIVEVVVVEGLIQAIVPVSSGEEEWLSPGFIDLQINGCCGHDLNELSLSPEDVVALAQQLAALGVTTFLPTLITTPEERLVAGSSVWSPSPRTGTVPSTTSRTAYAEESLSPWGIPTPIPREYMLPLRQVQSSPRISVTEWPASCCGIQTFSGLNSRTIASPPLSLRTDTISPQTHSLRCGGPKASNAVC